MANSCHSHDLTRATTCCYHNWPFAPTYTCVGLYTPFPCSNTFFVEIQHVSNYQKHHISYTQWDWIILALTQNRTPSISSHHCHKKPTCAATSSIVIFESRSSPLSFLLTTRTWSSTPLWLNLQPWTSNLLHWTDFEVSKYQHSVSFQNLINASSRWTLPCNFLFTPEPRNH